MGSANSVKEFKKLYQKHTGKEITDSEAKEYADRLYTLAEIVFKVAKQEVGRKKRLETEPGGFSIDESEGIFSCLICHKSISGANTWWDLNGLRCMDCQNNITDGVISADICKNDKSWFKDWQLKSDFGVHPMTAKKMKREGKLHGRELKDSSGNVYFTVYMVNENIAFLKGVKDGINKKHRTNPLFTDENGENIF